MKKVALYLFVLSAIFFTGCKYDLKPAGTYTGTYSSYNIAALPVTSGNGTLVLTEVDATHYDILFSSPGNSDMTFPNTVLTRTYSQDGTTFSLDYGSYSSPPYWYANILERDYLGKTWVIDFHYDEYTGSMYFDGQKQQ